MGGAAYFFFVGLALAIIYLYLGIRRGWGQRRNVILIGIVLCAVAMTLVQAANPGADIGLAIIYGVPLGVLIGIATTVVALYFARNEHREAMSIDAEE